MADIKEITVRKSELDKQNISAYISLSYDSLREVLESICISRGYKVLSHVCIGELLRNLLEDFDYSEFDRLRYTRNSVNYYGIKVEFNQSREIINKIFVMKKELLVECLAKFIK